MNKRELVLIVLLILVFDLNGFCDMVTGHIPFKKSFNLLTYLLSIVFLLFDVFVFHYVISHEPEGDIAFAVEDHKKTQTENENADMLPTTDPTLTTEIKQEIKEQIKEDENMFSLAEKIVINFLAVAILCMIIATIYFSAKSNSPNVSSPSKVLVLLIPLILVVSSLCAFGNIYLNL